MKIMPVKMASLVLWLTFFIIFKYQTSLVSIDPTCSRILTNYHGWSPRTWKQIIFQHPIPTRISRCTVFKNIDELSRWPSLPRISRFIKCINLLLAIILIHDKYSGRVACSGFILVNTIFLSVLICDSFNGHGLERYLFS